VECASALLEAAPVSTPSAMIIDVPFVGNGNLGAAVSAQDGLQFWLGANNMWSTNTAPDHGLCDAAANSVNPTHSGAVYTLISAGLLTLQAPSLRNASFRAEMNLAQGSLAANLSAAGAGGLRTRSFVAADRDALVVRLEADAPLTVSVEASVPESATVVSGKAPWVIPTEAGHAGGTIHAPRQGVNQVDNNVLLNTCGRGGQHAGSQRFRVGADGAVTLSDGRCLVLAGRPKGRDCSNATRRITIGPCGGPTTAWKMARGQLSLTDGGTTYFAGLLKMRPAPPPGPAGKPVHPQPGFTSFPGDVGGQSQHGAPLCNCSSAAACPAEAAKQCAASADCHSFAVYEHGGHAGWKGWCQTYGAKDTAARYQDPGWNLWKKNSNESDSAALGDAEGDAFSPVPFVVAEPSSSGTWTFDADSGALSLGNVSAVPGGAACLTIAEPNRNLNAAVAATVAPESGVAQEPQLEARSNGAYASNFTIKLLPGKPQHLVVGVHVCCKGCQAIGTPACAALPASNAGGNGAVSAAVSLAAAVAKDVAAEEASTRGWWDRYWNASSINLGPRYRQLEQFYYGLQVSAGSATFAAFEQESLKKTLRAVHRRRGVASGPHGPRAVVSAARLAFVLPAAA